jgi:hypothetical protein
MRLIVLTKTEIYLCKHIAEVRNYITSSNTLDRIQSSRDNLEITVDGVMAEYAVSKLLNLHFSFNCDYRKFEADLITPDGLMIDVKSTRKPGGNLNAVLWSTKKDADLYICTEILDEAVRVVGAISKQAFLTQRNLQDRGNGPFYSVPQSALIPI